MRPTSSIAPSSGVLLALLLAGGPRPAASQPGDREQVIEEVLVLSGIKAQIDQIPLMMDAQLLQQQAHGAAVPAAEFDRLRHVVAAAYHRDAIYRHVVARFQQHFDQERLAAVLAWLQEPPIRTITQAELASLGEQADEEMATFMTQMEVEPPTPQRVALVQRLAQATDATQQLTEMTVAMVRGVATVVDPVLPPDKRLKAGELDAMAQTLREGYAEELGDSVMVNLLFTYRTIPDETLQAYAEFWETDTGRWFSGLYSQAMIDAAAGAAQQAAGELVKLFPPADQGQPRQQEAGAGGGRAP